MASSNFNEVIRARDIISNSCAEACGKCKPGLHPISAPHTHRYRSEQNQTRETDRKCQVAQGLREDDKIIKSNL